MHDIANSGIISDHSIHIELCELVNLNEYNGLRNFFALLILIS